MTPTPCPDRALVNAFSRRHARDSDSPETVSGTVEVEVYIGKWSPWSERVEVQYRDVPLVDGELDTGDVLGNQIEAYLDGKFGPDVPRRWNLA